MISPSRLEKIQDKHIILIKKEGTPKIIDHSHKDLEKKISSMDKGYDQNIASLTNLISGTLKINLKNNVLVTSNKQG